VADGTFAARDRIQACSYWDLRQEVNLAVSAADLPAPIERGGSADSAALRRIDLRGKLSGGAFIQDMRLPGMLHGRVIRDRNPAALGNALAHALGGRMRRMPLTPGPIRAAIEAG
jgi:hypothetical protein